jgi:hypothetical protein
MSAIFYPDKLDHFIKEKLRVRYYGRYMDDLYLIHADKAEITEAEFEAAGGVARLVDGEIVLGKTEAETQAEQNAERARVLREQLAGTDYIVVKIAEGSGSQS